MEKVEAVFGGPLARGSPGYGALKRGGGEGGGMKISRGGVEWACLWYIPMFRFPGVKRGDGVFSSCFGTCCLYFEGGVEGGRGGEGGWL